LWQTDSPNRNKETALNEMTSYQILKPDDPRWIEYVTSNRHANIFHHPAWIKTLSQSYGYRPFFIAITDTDGKVTGGAPMAEIKSVLTGHRWVSLPYTDHCEPLYNNTEVLAQLTEVLVMLFKQNNAPRIGLRWSYSDNDYIQTICSFVLHTINLRRNIDEIEQDLSKRYRQRYRSAESKGVHVEFGKELHHVRQFYELQAITRKRHGLPVQPWRFFEMLWQQIIAKGLGFTLLANYEDECIGGLIVIHWNDTVTFKYSASIPCTPNLYQNYRLFWEGICWALENGYTVGDLGRCQLDNEGLRRFKAGWAEEVPLDYSIITNEPVIASDDSKIMKISEIVIRSMPTMVCKAAGRLLYRHFD
jgi:hypothetical protein